MPGHKILAKLNKMFAAYGVGRGVYTGDTTIGLKGRIINALGARALGTLARSAAVPALP